MQLVHGETIKVVNFEVGSLKSLELSQVSLLSREKLKHEHQFRVLFERILAFGLDFFGANNISEVANFFKAELQVTCVLDLKLAVFRILNLRDAFLHNHQVQLVYLQFLLMLRLGTQKQVIKKLLVLKKIVVQQKLNREFTIFNVHLSKQNFFELLKLGPEATF